MQFVHIRCLIIVTYYLSCILLLRNVVADSGRRFRLTLFLHGVCMLRECIMVSVHTSST